MTWKATYWASATPNNIGKRSPTAYARRLSMLAETKAGKRMTPTARKKHESKSRNEWSAKAKALKAKKGKR